MTSWRENYKDLRDRFIARAFKRLEEMSALAASLESQPNDRTMLRDLLRHFHWFTGQGTTFGFPDATQLGLEAEQHCEQIVNEGDSVGPADRARFRGWIGSLKTQLESAKQEAAEAPAPGTARQESRSMDILIVDAEQDTMLQMARLLEDHGMSVRNARSVGSALEALCTSLPDGIIVEALLPDGNGYELVEQLRQLPGGSHPAVFIVSRLSGFVDKVRAIHCGADAYFEKTTNWERMVARLRFLLGKQRVEPYKILSVEDEPDQAIFIKTFLESAGYVVRICTEPSGVEEALTGFQPDLVLLDVLMPGISGYEVARYIRQDDRYATLPVVFLSAKSSVEHVVASAKAGADAHLTKPVDSQLLLATVAAQLERSRLLKSLLYRDGLTRLLTHTAFIEQAKSLVANLRRHYDRTAALVLIDMDHFRSVNTEYGHPVGDKVLAALSSLILQRFRQSDLIGRLSGQQFALVVEDLEEFEAANLIEKLLSDFSEIRHHDTTGVAFAVTFSAGIAMYASRSTDFDQWLDAAAKALAAAKASGRACVRATTRPGANVGV